MTIEQLHKCALAFVAAVCMTASYAQDDEQTEKHWNGIRAGYHMSNFEGDNGPTADRNGYYAGYYRNLLKIPLYSLSSGLEFHTAGSASDENEVRLSYLSMPINNRLKLGPVYVDLGADLALKVHERVLVGGNEVDVDGDSKAQSVDVLVHGGVGFKVLMFGIEARYRRGLTEVYEGTYNAGVELGLSLFF